MNKSTTQPKSKSPHAHKTSKPSALRTTSRRTIRTAKSILSHSSISKSKPSKLRSNQKRSFFFPTPDRRVVYEPLNSLNPITLRSTLVPTAYTFPPYILPSIDIVSTMSRQLVTPSYAEQCYIIDKTPKLLQLPSISAVTNDSKFVQVFAEATICVTNSLKFSLLGDTYVESLQSLVETATSNVVSYISEKDCLDKQYEAFLVTNIHEDLQRLCDDVGVDVLKLVVIPTQLNLTNVAAQLQLIQTMNDLSMAINPTQHNYLETDNFQEQSSQHQNPLDKMAQTNIQSRVDADDIAHPEAKDVAVLVHKLMGLSTEARNKLLSQLQSDAQIDTIPDLPSQQTQQSQPPSAPVDDKAKQ